jgi:MoaA/NifB/PqqE/SkfB family radical SAM enzyme
MEARRMDNAWNGSCSATGMGHGSSPLNAVDFAQAPFLVIWETTQACLACKHCRASARPFREAPLFRRLRNPELLKGRCGQCEVRGICAGSRSRARALTGDAFATDPWCTYSPGRTMSTPGDGGQAS